MVRRSAFSTRHHQAPPPFGAELPKALEEKKPKLHVLGHIHGGAGTYVNGFTLFVNASFLNERCDPGDPAGRLHVIDL
jgi:hypothetical protein